MKLFLTICLIFSVFSTAAAAQTDATKNLYALFDSEWEWALRENPTFASYLGDKRYNALWNDVSLEAINRRNQHRAETLARLRRIDRQALSVIFPDRDIESALLYTASARFYPLGC